MSYNMRTSACVYLQRAAVSGQSRLQFVHGSLVKASRSNGLHPFRFQEAAAQGAGALVDTMHVTGPLLITNSQSAPDKRGPAEGGARGCCPRIGGHIGLAAA